jgi:hypothetical protein
MATCEVQRSGCEYFSSFFSKNVKKIPKKVRCLINSVIYVKQNLNCSINLTKPIMFSDFFSGEILHPTNDERRWPV